MTRPVLVRRRSFLRASLALALATALAGPAAAHRPAAPSLVEVDIVDRASGTTLPVHAKDGQRYVVGTPGHEYAIRLRNRTGGRVLAVTSVDGVNVVTGDTASPDQSGYVLEPWGSVEIAGWRKSLSTTAAFFFTEHAQSYAARTGRPFDVGVIGVAAFAERARPPLPAILGEAKRERRAQAADAAAAEAPAAPSAAEADAPAAAPRFRAESAPATKLGTGHGRQEASPVRQVSFERATREPAQIVAVQYDRYENLVAMGVIDVAPRHAYAPRPFPGLRFVPDPR